VSPVPLVSGWETHTFNETAIGRLRESATPC
jgi:hypothetical protein